VVESSTGGKFILNWFYVGKRPDFLENFDCLLRGTPEDVYKQARYNIAAGVDSISPECAIALETPIANLKAIVSAAEEGY